MKLYHTVAQQFFSENNSENLSNYLDNNDIKYRISAEFLSDLIRSGRVNISNVGIEFVKLYIILIEDEAISLLKLRIDNVYVVKNSFFVEMKNRFRKLFKLFYR